MIREESGDRSDGVMVQILKIKSIRSLIIILFLLILGVLLLPESDPHHQSANIQSSSDLDIDEGN